MKIKEKKHRILIRKKMCMFNGKGKRKRSWFIVNVDKKKSRVDEDKMK